MKNPSPSAAGPSVEEILRECHAQLVAILERFDIPGEDADDILQETYFALVFKWDSIRNPPAWLATTLRNRCQMYWRRQRADDTERVDVRLLDILAGPQVAPQHRTELRADLNAAIAKLPANCRDLIRLRYGLGLESREVREEMGEETDSLRQLTNFCLATLGRELRRSGFRGLDNQPH